MNLHEACKNADITEMKALLEQGANINSRSHEDDGERVPLEEAIESGQLEAVKFLLASGADVNAKNRYGGTPLKHAAIIGDPSIVKLLIDNGADVNSRDYAGTPMDWARRFNRTEIAELLSQHGGQSARTPA